jgi:hypothetical protein
MKRAAISVVVSILSISVLQGADASFIGNLKTVKVHASTVPSNGDQNPYGVAVVPETHGRLLANHVLVSNFNNSNNFQGTGTTIVQVSPGDGSTSLFAQLDSAQLASSCPGGVGLTTALVVLRSGWVIVGSLPTSNSGSTFAGAGCLIVLNSSGSVAKTITDPTINGPWDMTALDMGSTAVLFVTNVLNGTLAGMGHVVSGGTVLRINLDIPAGGAPSATGITTIGSGFSEVTDPMALVIGPTGVGLGTNGTLYVADTLNSRIVAIDGALTATPGAVRTVSGGGALNGPLGLAIAPNGNIITVNSGDGNMVETTPGGVQVATKTVIAGMANGDLFGLAIRPDGSGGVYFVNDGNNTLDLLH